jgi:apolipoprotein N-acyltransferase
MGIGDGILGMLLPYGIVSLGFQGLLGVGGWVRLFSLWGLSLYYVLLPLLWLAVEEGVRGKRRVRAFVLLSGFLVLFGVGELLRVERERIGRLRLEVLPLVSAGRNDRDRRELYESFLKVLQNKEQGVVYLTPEAPFGGLKDEELTALSVVSAMRRLYVGIGRWERVERGYRNIYELWGPHGVVGRVEKRRLLPLAEWVPGWLRESSFWQKWAGPAWGKVYVGRGGSVIHLGGNALQVEICGEVAYGWGSGERVGLLLNPSNDRWYGWGFSERLLKFLQLKSKVYGMYGVRISSGGVSAIVGPDGKIVEGEALSRLLKEGVPVMGSRLNP